MDKSPFKNDENFFKSHELNGNGELLLKAIPKMPEQKINNYNKERKVPSEVKKFKDKVESMCNEIDNIIKEVIDKKGLNRSKFLVEKYTSFKSELQYCLNEMINYPDNHSEIESPYSKSRILINK